MDFTKDQKDTMFKLRNWYKKQDKQIFTIDGYAGTGKSTSVRYFLQDMGIEAGQYASMTLSGKASLVLSNMGTPTTTMHSRMYYVENEEIILPSGKKGYKQNFYLNREAMVGIKLIVIDEISMVNLQLLRDAMSFGIPIVTLGDIMQLPPIGEDNKLLHNPDAKLTEITRQAADNPIIYISMLLRKRKYVEPGLYRDPQGVARVAVIPAQRGINSLTDRMLMNSDQIICGYNRTRKAINNIARELRGYTSELPQAGDKIMCTRNNWDLTVGGIPLINGLTGYAAKDAYDIDDFDRTFKLDFYSDFDKNKRVTSILADTQDFINYPNGTFFQEDRAINHFDFGYGSTCHKAQGSEYGKVVLFEEVLDIEEHHRWLYTGSTRAKDILVYYQRTA